MTQHIIRIKDDVFDAINNHIKNFIVCREHGYRVGDTVKILCVDKEGSVKTVPDYKQNKEVEFRCLVRIDYIQYADDSDTLDVLDKDYCILGISRVN